MSRNNVPIKLQFFLCIFAIAVSGIDHPYCKLPCEKGWGSESHTVCRLAPCYIGWSCNRGAKMLELTDSDRELIMNKHNFYRSQVASGKDTRGGNEKAANMMAFSYDTELEFIAQCFTNSCPSTHDKCRRTAKLPRVGQNLFWTTTYENLTIPSILESAVTAWFEEIQYMNPTIIKKFAGSSKYGHATQLLWAQTAFVGCGRTQTGPKSMVFACNYGIAGNLLGASIYVAGAPCSQCGSQPCNGQNEGLCGPSALIKTFQAPFALDATIVQLNKGLLASILIMLLILN